MSSPIQTAVDVARVLAEAMLKLVPAPVASQLISDEAVKRANAIADLAEDVKFGSDP